MEIYTGIEKGLYDSKRDIKQYQDLWIQHQVDTDVFRLPISYNEEAMPEKLSVEREIVIAIQNAKQRGQNFINIIDFGCGQNGKFINQVYELLNLEGDLLRDFSVNIIGITGELEEKETDVLDSKFIGNVEFNSSKSINIFEHTVTNRRPDQSDNLYNYLKGKFGEDFKADLIFSTWALGYLTPQNFQSTTNILAESLVSGGKFFCNQHSICPPGFYLYFGLPLPDLIRRPSIKSLDRDPYNNNLGQKIVLLENYLNGIVLNNPQYNIDFEESLVIIQELIQKFDLNFNEIFNSEFENLLALNIYKYYAPDNKYAQQYSVEYKNTLIDTFSQALDVPREYILEKLQEVSINSLSDGDRDEKKLKHKLKSKLNKGITTKLFGRSRNADENITQLEDFLEEKGFFHNYNSIIRTLLFGAFNIKLIQKQYKKIYSSRMMTLKELEDKGFMVASKGYNLFIQKP